MYSNRYTNRVFAYELSKAGLQFEQQVRLPLTYDGMVFKSAYRVDFVVEGELIVELKSVERLLPVHHSQVLTYLKLSGLSHGLLFNFNETLLKNGIRSIVLGYPKENFVSS